MDKKTHSNRKWITAYAAAMLFAATAQAQDKVTVTDRPLVSTSSNYTNFRAPLRQAPLLKLPVGQVQPRGWLRKYLELQRDGLNGKLNTISAWLDKNNNQWLSDSGDHGWEEVPYWLRGYCSLAYILDDEDMKKEAQVWFDAVFENLKSDGFLPRSAFSENQHSRMIPRSDPVDPFLQILQRGAFADQFPIAEAFVMLDQLLFAFGPLGFRIVLRDMPDRSAVGFFILIVAIDIHRRFQKLMIAKSRSPGIFRKNQRFDVIIRNLKIIEV